MIKTNKKLLNYEVKYTNIVNIFKQWVICRHKWKELDDSLKASDAQNRKNLKLIFKDGKIYKYTP